MTTDSQDTRYRNGYAAGQRDDMYPSDDEPNNPKRPATGDPWSDLGYNEGFADRHATQHPSSLRRAGETLAQVLRLPERSQAGPAVSPETPGGMHEHSSPHHVPQSNRMPWACEYALEHYRRNTATRTEITQ